jgi:hypothetical protein
LAWQFTAVWHVILDEDSYAGGTQPDAEGPDAGGQLPDSSGQVPDASGRVPDAGGQVPDFFSDKEPDADGQVPEFLAINSRMLAAKCRILAKISQTSRISE